MKTKPNADTERASERAFAEALFVKEFADDPLAQRIMSHVALWPRKVEDLEPIAKRLRWKASYSRGRSRTWDEIRLAPPVQALLDLLLPALAGRDSRPFRLFAQAIDAAESQFPDCKLAYHALALAHELGARPAPFNEKGESLVPFDIPDEQKRAMIEEICGPLELANAGPLCVPISQSQFLRRVEKLIERQISAPQFHRLCERLNITFAKDPRRGGRPRKRK
jgi:hypothetical protein